MNGSVGSDGYVVDFGEVKKAMRSICQELDEHFLLPEKSRFLTISQGKEQVDILTNSGSRFSFPSADVIRLPLSNISVEELSQYICHRFVDRVTADALQRHSIVQITVGVAETANQEARFTVDVGTVAMSPHPLVRLAGSAAATTTAAAHHQPPLDSSEEESVSSATSPRRVDSDGSTATACVSMPGTSSGPPSTGSIAAAGTSLGGAFPVPEEEIGMSAIAGAGDMV